jgi:hypothetical protein
MSEQCNRSLLAGRAMWALFIVVPAPSLRLLPSIFKAHEPVGVQTFHPEASIEALEKALSIGAVDAVVSCDPADRSGVALIATDPFAHCAGADAYGFTDSLRRLPTEDQADQALSTERRQASIPIDVHSAPPRNVDVGRRRVDNLLNAHI